MSHEYELHIRVSNLISLLKVQDVSGSKAHVEVLFANRVPYVTTTVSTHAAKRTIAELSSKGEAFLKKYEELKLKQPRDLDPLVYLLSKMAVDKPLCEFVRTRRPPKPKPLAREASIAEVVGKVDGEELKLPAKGAVLTAEEISQWKGTLEIFAANIQGQQKKQQVKKIPGTFPDMPAWLKERPYLSCDFLPLAARAGGSVGGHGARPSPPQTAAVHVGSLPLEMQQLAMMEDLLHAMVGLDGRYVTSQTLADPQGARQFDVDATLDVSLRVLSTRILSVCAHYSYVVRFVERNADYVHGTVNQALGAAMRDLVKEYLIVAAQLEHQLLSGQLTLQKMWYYVQPCLRTLEVLSHVAFLVDKGECRGGKTLSVLHRTASGGGYVGDRSAQEVCLHLARTASRPYFEMLERWIYKGRVSDTYAEFMVEEHEVGKDRLREEYNDAYWDTRYTVVQENIPSFLEQLTGKIRDAGKYLNVLYECGRHGDGDDDDKADGEDEGEGEGGEGTRREVRYSVLEGHYVERVEWAYTRASRELLAMMVKEHDLAGHLRSIKHYYLIDQGDFFVHFMDMAEGELKKAVADISPTRLESLLELALHASLVSLDPYRENLRPVLVHCDLITQLRDIIAIQPEAIGPQALTPRSIRRTMKKPEELCGLDALCLDYVVQWPLSLILNRKVLFKYQMLFRHLFHCLYAERQLCKAWTGHRVGKACSLRAFPVYASSFALLQRMLHYVQNLQYFMAFEVLEPNWCTLETHLASVTTVDDVLAAHTAFLDKCLNDCMLSNKAAIERIHHLLTLCVAFARQMQQVVALLDAAMATAGVGGGKAGKKGARKVEGGGGVVVGALQATVTGKAFEQMVTSTERDFTKSLTILLGHLHQLSTQEVGHMTSGMASRLDFNGFYQCHSPS